MVRFDGSTKDKVNLWHTYVHWAKEQAVSCPGSLPSPRNAIADDPNNRVELGLSEALRTILFASFLLEARLRLVLSAFGLRVRPRTTLGPLLDCFWRRLSGTVRIQGGGLCAAPDGWKRCEPVLRNLVRLRNLIVHSDSNGILMALGQNVQPVSIALEHYNAVIDAICLINEGTGYDARSARELAGYFEPLKVGFEP